MTQPPQETGSVPALRGLDGSIVLRDSNGCVDFIRGSLEDIPVSRWGWTDEDTYDYFFQPGCERVI